jgi:hypothetical protein
VDGAVLSRRFEANHRGLKHRHVWLAVWTGTAWREVCIYACGVGYRRLR